MPRNRHGAERSAGVRRPASGGARRMLRRRLALAPRACALMGCSLVLVVGGMSAYGLAVPSLAAARAARVPHIARAAHGDLGTTTGYVWADVFSRTVLGDDAAPGEGGASASAGKDKDEVKLADGTVIRLTSVRHVTQLVQAQNSIRNLAASATGTGAAAGAGAKKGAGAGSGSGGNATSNGGGSGAGTGDGGSNGSTDGGSNGGGNTGGNQGSDGSPSTGGLSDAEEESIHSWLKVKYDMLDGYVSRANTAVATYGATGDTSACDDLCTEMFPIRAEFGRQAFPSRSKWYRQFAKLWGCYTNLAIWVGHYGNDDVALGNFSDDLAELAL